MKRDLRGKLFFLTFILAVFAMLIPAAVAQQSGQILYLPLSEGMGEALSDRSGNGNDCTLVGGTWMTGKFGTGVYLDGVDDYIEVPGILTESATIEFWFKPDWSGDDAEDYRLFDASLGAIYFFIGKGANHADITPAEFGLYFEDASDADWQDIEFNPIDVIKAGEWHHIAATWEFGGGLAFIYLNGEEMDSSPNVLGGFPALHPSPRFGLKVIDYVASKNGAMGVMDEIVIYNRALTVDEIAADMQELGFAVEATEKVLDTWGRIKAEY